MAASKLAKYQKMRDFSATAEPSGRDAKVRPSNALRFVIQKHAASHLHFDLRLEYAGTFRSWAVPKGPSLDPKVRRMAMEVEDHPLDYGDFEGTIPKGQYGGGTVMLWDRGYWAPQAGFGDIGKALETGELKFVMEGERMHGAWVLVRLKAKLGLVEALTSLTCICRNEGALGAPSGRAPADPGLAAEPWPTSRRARARPRAPS